MADHPSSHACSALSSSKEGGIALDEEPTGPSSDSILLKVPLNESLKEEGACSALSSSKEGGIALDEEPTGPPSDSILPKVPFKRSTKGGDATSEVEDEIIPSISLSPTSNLPKVHVNLKGKDVSQIKIRSLSSSPSKRQSRSMDSLRNEGQSSDMISSKPKDGNSATLRLQADYPLMEDHVKPPSPSKHTHIPLYPVHTLLPVKNTTQDEIPGPTIPAKQQAALTSTKAIVSSQIPTDNNPSNLPIPTEISQPPKTYNIGMVGLDFPPLNGSTKPKTHSATFSTSTAPNPIPTKPTPSNEIHTNSLSSGNNDSWANIVRNTTSSSSMKLNYFKPTQMEGKIKLRVPSSVAQQGISHWKNTLVGFFLDKLPFSLVQNGASRLWGTKGLIEVLGNGNGFFFFKFDDDNSMRAALEGGPWYIGGRPLFLKKWMPSMNLTKAGCKHVPIWVHFHNVPLEYWTAEGLSYIASVVGRPIQADKMTESLKRINYARICIEIGVDDPLPSSFDLELEDGSIMEIQIEYNWVPKKCSFCKDFGHLSKNCKRQGHQEWAVKPPTKSAMNHAIEDDWKEVKRHGKEVIVDSTPPPCILEDTKTSADNGCSTSNAFAVLQQVHAREEERTELDIAHKNDNRDISPNVLKEEVPIPAELEGNGNGEEAQHSSAIGTTPVSNREELRSSNSPSSASSSDPLHHPLIKKLNMIDEIEQKHKKKKKEKKKNGSSGGSSGKNSKPSS